MSEVNGESASAGLYFAKEPDEHTPSRSIRFATDEAGVVGTLHLGPPMTFEGDAEESARVFFEQVVRRAGG